MVTKVVPTLATLGNKTQTEVILLVLCPLAQVAKVSIFTIKKQMNCKSTSRQQTSVIHSVNPMVKL
jgi:hypothetical protein